MIEKIGHLDNGIRKVMNGNYRFLRSRVPARNESKTEEIDHNDSYEGSVTELKRNSYLENLVAMRKDSGQYISKPALFPDTEQTQTRMSQLAMEMYEINDSENGAINSFEVLNELTDNIDLISEEGKALQSRHVQSRYPHKKSEEVSRFSRKVVIKWSIRQRNDGSCTINIWKQNWNIESCLIMIFKTIHQKRLIGGANYCNFCFV